MYREVTQKQPLNDWSASAQTRWVISDGIMTVLTAVFLFL